jgi:hypothetical protein
MALSRQREQTLLVRSWRMVAILFTALSLAPALAHLLEMPAKLGYDGRLWVTLQQSLYGPGFGTVGAFCEVGAVVTTAVLAILVRSRGPAFGWTVLGAVCVMAAHAAFWIWIAPVNTVIASLSPEALPANWTELRTQWEYTHAVRAILQIVALAALVFSLLVEIPRDRRRASERTRAGGRAAPRAAPTR